ncbi:hypothetical protein DFH27DRAFT_530020 [Peziza echinospora]|nr:hypothetical protein DFH27DRAFT_530020 [Peziza echinospora]
MTRMKKHTFLAWESSQHQKDWRQRSTDKQTALEICNSIGSWAYQGQPPPNRESPQLVEQKRKDAAYGLARPCQIRPPSAARLPLSGSEKNKKGNKQNQAFAPEKKKEKNMSSYNTDSDDVSSVSSDHCHAGHDTSSNAGACGLAMLKSRNYTRNLVDEGNGNANLLILVWTPEKAPSSTTTPNAHCIMKILKGTLVETLYDWPDQEVCTATSTATTTASRNHIPHNPPQNPKIHNPRERRCSVH